MGWTQTAPSVKTWEQEKSTTYKATYWSLTTTQSFGRTSGNGFAVKVVWTQTATGQPSGQCYLSAQVGSATADVDTSHDMLVGSQTVTFYYVGEAAEGVTVTTTVGRNGESGTMKSCTFTAPKAAGAMVYVNVNGTWKEATMFVNVGGTWKEAQAKINVGGDWK